MIKAVQTNACELAEAKNAEIESDDLTQENHTTDNTTEDDDDCVYVSPDETENGKIVEIFHVLTQNDLDFLLIFFNFS